MNHTVLTGFKGLVDELMDRPEQIEHLLWSVEGDVGILGNAEVEVLEPLLILMVVRTRALAVDYVVDFPCPQKFKIGSGTYIANEKLTASFGILVNAVWLVSLGNLIDGKPRVIYSWIMVELLL